MGCSVRSPMISALHAAATINDIVGDDKGRRTGAEDRDGTATAGQRAHWTGTGMVVPAAVTEYLRPESRSRRSRGRRAAAKVRSRPRRGRRAGTPIIACGAGCRPPLGG